MQILYCHDRVRWRALIDLEFEYQMEECANQGDTLLGARTNLSPTDLLYVRTSAPYANSALYLKQARW